MYQLDYVPIRLANLNDYFTRYRETKDEKYFNISIDRFRAEGLSNKLPLVKFDNFADIIVLEADLRKQNDLQ